MKKLLVLSGVSLLCALQGCSLTLPVKGVFQNSTETFTGTATGYMNGTGVLTITSSSGTVCKGNFVYETRRTGKGIFTCGDNRSGPFEFSSSGSSGTGVGDLGGQKFVFTFGDWCLETTKGEAKRYPLASLEAAITGDKNPLQFTLSLSCQQTT